MKVQQSHLLAAAMLILVLALGYVQHQSASRSDESDRQQSITACVRNSERAAMNAVGWHEVVKARVERKDTKRAIQDAAAVEEAVMATVPAPKGTPAGSPTMFEVVTVEYKSGKRTLELTPKAAALQKAGCERVFPPR